ALRSGHDPTAPRFSGDASAGPRLDLGLPVHPPLPTCEWLPCDYQTCVWRASVGSTDASASLLAHRCRWTDARKGRGRRLAGPHNLDPLECWCCLVRNGGRLAV